jgi:hypothetical protein
MRYSADIPKHTDDADENKDEDKSDRRQVKEPGER